MGTVNVCECVRQSDSVRSFLNVTTDKVYLNRETGQDYTEDEQLNGFDPYSNSKSCSELVTSSYVNSFLKAKGVAASTARSGNVIGGGDFSENRIIPDCVKASADGKEIEIRNLTSQRPYQFVLDTLYAYLLIVQNQWGNSNIAGAYNIGPDNPTDNQILVTKFCEAWGENAKWKHIGDPNAPHEAKLLSLNCDKIKQTFDWKPVYSIGEAVRLSAEWYKEFYNGGNANEIMQKQIKECLNAYNN
jgi:CDP-glucose 4,6-dehydratase